jgi:hypothetical protein
MSHTHLTLRGDADGRAYDVAIDNVFANGYRHNPRIAPVAPIGWPWATAPPSTLTMSSGTPSSRATAIGTAAKASLISMR